jgi:hypothetical protein
MLYYGLVLVGIYMLVEGVSGLATIPAAVSHYDSELSRFVLSEDWWALALGLTAAISLFSVLPGALLVKFAGPISERFSRGNAIEASDVSNSGLYVVLLIALSVFFLVTGISQIAIGLVQLIPEIWDYNEYTLRFGLGPFLGGVVRVIGAIWIYYHLMGATRPAA